jgi:hypothetical protein
LTPAHCITEQGTIILKLVDWVKFNRHDLTKHEPGAVRMSLEAAHQIFHEKYNPLDADFDVAVLILPMAVSGITPVRLNKNSKVPSAGAPLDVDGWGHTVPLHLIFRIIPQFLKKNYP